MHERPEQVEVMVSIAGVERDTGLSKDTLRVWERRYGFPTPARDQFGERVYPLEQVEKLRLLRRLMGAGHRPGKIIALSADRLHQLAADTIAAPGQLGDSLDPHDDIQGYVDLIKAHDVEALRRTLSQAVMRLGLEGFVIGVVAPLNRAVGDGWARGWFRIFEEHLYTEAMQVILRGAIGNIAPGHSGPAVLLTTLPQEPHGLGLLMAEALMALEGCRCLSLGVQTPVWDIVQAARLRRTDIVALSFSGCMNQNQVVEALGELREHLPAEIEIWAGGSSAALQRKPVRGIHVVGDLRLIRPALGRWRQPGPRAVRTPDAG